MPLRLVLTLVAVCDGVLGEGGVDVGVDIG